MPDLYGAIDLGGTKLRALVADLEGDVRSEVIRSSEADKGPDHVIARMIETLEEAAAEASVAAAPLHDLPDDQHRSRRRHHHRRQGIPRHLRLSRGARAHGGLVQRAALSMRGARLP